MTLYALGDYHGRSIQEFLEKEAPTSDDIVLSTGDFDQTNVIHEFLDLKERIGEESVIDVGGNHDNAILEELPITSGTIESQSKHFYEMVDELHQDPVAKDYLQEIVNNPIREFEVGDLNGVLVHGGLAGHIQSRNITEEMKPFWYRLWDDEDFEENFDRMDRKDYDLMIRGHDHRKDHVMRLKDGYEPTYRSRNLEESYELEESYRHIFTHGAWYKGEYLVIDEDSLEAEFRSVEK
ncbi:MAG: putative phosphodiesterase [Candidatus Nanohaloarchaea archaeon]|jgi:predicted phosphodiesterase